MESAKASMDCRGSQRYPRPKAIPWLAKACSCYHRSKRTSQVSHYIYMAILVEIPLL